MSESSPDVITDLVRGLRADTTRAALLFDIDGVLAPIVPRAGDAHVPGETADLLATLRDHYLVVGLVSGRALADVDRMVPVPGLARGGNHGLEVALPGAAAELVPDARPHADAMRAFVDAHPDEVLGPHDVWLEDKGASVSMHYRQAGDPGAAEAYLTTEVADAARALGLRVRRGRMILEVLPDVDVDKGDVVRQIVRATGVRVALYVGDDRTDMDAWRALRDMQATGEIERALCVLADQPEVDSTVREAADVALDGTPGVLALLRALAA